MTTRRYYPTLDSTSLRTDIPTLTWLRLRWHRRRHGLDMVDATNQALSAGLDALGVPRRPEDLLAPQAQAEPAARN